MFSKDSPNHARRAAHAALSVLALLSASNPALAGETNEGTSRLKLSADVRLFAEAMDGQFRPAPAPGDDVLISSRTLIVAEYDLGGVRIGGELDDSRGYAERKTSTVTTSEINALELLQAYVAIDLGGGPAGGGSSQLTLGRFTMDVGAGRLVARPDFSNSPQSFLGANLLWRGRSGDRILGFWTMPFDRLPDGAADIRDNHVEFDRATSDRQFFGVDAVKTGLVPQASIELYGYGLVERDGPGRPTKNRRLFTFGGRLLRAPAAGHADFEIEGAVQGGRIRATTAAADRNDMDVRAQLLHAEGGWTFGGGWTPRVALLFDYASGDGPGSGSFGRFDTLYGARRIDFGPTSLYGPVGRSNLVSAGLTVEGKPAGGWDFFVKARELWLAEATDSFASTGVRDIAGGSGRHAGAQVEWRVRTWLVPKRLRIECGGAYLSKGKFLKSAPNAPEARDTRYAFLGLSASL